MTPLDIMLGYLERSLASLLHEINSKPVLHIAILLL